MVVVVVVVAAVVVVVVVAVMVVAVLAAVVVEVMWRIWGGFIPIYRVTAGDSDCMRMTSHAHARKRHPIRGVEYFTNKPTTLFHPPSSHSSKRH